jgi:hypothetical protein
VNRAKLIDNKNILKRMSLLLAAVLQLLVSFIAWTMNGTFYGVMDKKGDVSVKGGASSCSRCANSSAVRAESRFCGDST